MTQRRNGFSQQSNVGLPYYLLFLINPFLALIVGLRNVPSAFIVRTIIVLSSAFYGGTFVVESAASDAYVHLKGFESIDTDQSLWNYLSYNQRNHGDALLFGLKYLVRLFTDNGAVFFVVLGLLYGLIVGRTVTILLFDILAVRRLSKVMLLAVVYIFLYI